MRARPVCDDGRELCVPREYLERGNLDHGYAQTVHKTQGATVDRTFVLGTEEAYREWGYTALTRHRVEARFYATAPEPGDLRAPERDEPDPRERIERRLGHGRAKRLAIDVRDEALRALPHAQLEAEAKELRAEWAGYPSHAALKERSMGEELERVRRSRSGLDDQVQRLREQAPRGWRERRRDPTHDDRLAAAAAHRDEWTEREAKLERDLDALREGPRSPDAWLARNAANLGRLVALERELGERRAADREARLRRVAVDPSAHTIGALGEPPESPAQRERWERAARALERFRLDYLDDPGAVSAPLGPPGVDRGAWEGAARKLNAARDELGLDPLTLDALTGEELAVEERDRRAQLDAAGLPADELDTGLDL